MAAAVLWPRSERFAEDTCHKHNGFEKRHKRGRQKMVTWPLDEKLCEVRHFFADDAPSLLGVAVQGFLHSKQRSLLPTHNTPSYKESNYYIGYHPTEAKRARFTSVAKPDGNLVGVSPGPGLSTAKKSPICEVEFEATKAIAAPWHRPQKFILDDSWLWAGGEESTEVTLQQQRELRLLEAFFPRLASIPDSPAEPLERSKQVDDSAVVLVPLIPLDEEEEEMQDVASVKMTENICTDNIVPECREMTDPLKHGTDASKHGNGILQSNPMAESEKVKKAKVMSEADSNIAAVAAAACMVVKSLGESDLVDQKLLLELLTNPSLLESLTCSNQVVKSKSQVKNNNIANRISQEPITGILDKLLAHDHGAHSNASPVSVLARWDEGSPCTTPIACGSTNIQQPAIPNTTDPPLTSSVPSQALHKSTHVGRDFSQKGLEIATRAIPERCMNSPFNPPNLQSSSFVHAFKPKDEVRLSCQNGMCDDMRSASCSMQSMPAVTPPNGPSALSTRLPNSELPWRNPLLGDPPLRRFVQSAESKSLQVKKTALGVPGGGRAKRFCMYFNSPRGCRNGGSCAFLHQSLDSELNTMAL